MATGAHGAEFVAAIDGRIAPISAASQAPPRLSFTLVRLPQC